MTLNARVICWSAAAVLSLAGLGLATYLSVIHLSGADLACGVSGGCGAVTTSEYSRFLGMPVALLGVGGYAVLLLGMPCGAGAGAAAGDAALGAGGRCLCGLRVLRVLDGDAGVSYRLVLRVLPDFGVADDGDYGADAGGGGEGSAVYQ